MNWTVFASEWARSFVSLLVAFAVIAVGGMSVLMAGVAIVYVGLGPILYYDYVYSSTIFSEESIRSGGFAVVLVAQVVWILIILAGVSAASDAYEEATNGDQDQ